MSEWRVSSLVNNYFLTKPDFALPKPILTCSISERIEKIKKVVQDKRIFNINPLPKEPTPEKILSWQKSYDHLLKKGVGLEPLLKVLPEYKNSDKILPKIRELYAINPLEAGLFAQKVLSFSPFLEYFDKYKRVRGLEEEFNQVTVPQTNEVILFQFDCLTVESITEFKLTTTKNLENQLRKGIIQLFLYDFCFRLQKPRPYHLPLMVDVCLLDQEKVLTYGYLDTVNSPMLVSTKLLKQVFEVNNFPELIQVCRVIDCLYKDLRPFTQADALELFEENKMRFGL